MKKLKLKTITLLLLSSLTGMSFFMLLFARYLVKDDVSQYFFRENILLIFYALSFITLATFILLFFNDQIFKLWSNKFMIWFIPLAFIIIASGTTGPSYAWLPRTDLAIILGAFLVVATLGIALTQRFYYKLK